MNSTRPKLSVIMTAYNHEPYLAHALEGALSQRTAFEFEIVVGDDASEDGTRAVLDRYRRRYPERIRAVLPEENLGANRMFVEVVRASRGEYLAMLDGDDYWVSPEKLERQVELLDADPSAFGCFHDASVVYEDGRCPSRPRLPALEKGRFTLGEVVERPFIPILTFVCRRIEAEDLERWLRKVGGEEWNRLLCADWLAIILSAQRGDLVYLPGVSAVYRVHPGGVWSSIDRLTQLADERRIYQRLNRHLQGISGEIENGLRRCNVEVAVEECGLPYGPPIAVVSPKPLAPYFNGRPVLELSGDEPNVPVRLRALRQMPVDRECSPHWASVSPDPALEGAWAFVVVVGGRATLERRPLVSQFLANAECVSVDDSAIILALRPRPVIEKEVTAVNLAHTSGTDTRWHVDRPVVGDRSRSGTLEVSGWLIGERVVEVVARGPHGVLGSGRLDVPRPDVRAAFSEATDEMCGFAFAADVADIERENVTVEALMESERRLLLADVALERRTN